MIAHKSWFLKRPVYYVYPTWHTVSFSIIAKQHINELRKYFRIYEIDELAFFKRDIFSEPLCIIHPYLFVTQRHPKLFFNMLDKFKACIGIDVADTDMIGRVGIQLINLSTALITHSNFAKQVYEYSGAKVPIYIVEHGLSKEFYEPKKMPKNKLLQEILRKKQENNYIYVLFFWIHSGERKGADLFMKILTEICRIHKNVKPVLKVGTPSHEHHEFIEKTKGFIIAGFLDTHDLVALYDMCDIYTLFSRGGGFELNGLEALSRELVTLAGLIGSWTDYLPDFLLIKKVHRVKFWIHTNPLTDIHCGYGYEVDVDEAINKLKNVIENLDDYKLRVREYWEKVKHEWTWENIGKKLKSILEKYL